MNEYKATARIVGGLFLTATFAYMAGDALVQSLVTAPDFLQHLYPARNRLVGGVLIQLVGAVANVGIGVFLFSLVRRHSETVAVGYLATRILDGAGVAIAGTAALGLLPLSQQALESGAQAAPALSMVGGLIVSGRHTLFLVTMIALGIGSIPFCYILYRSRLIPRLLAALGLLGYVALAAGSVLELVGWSPNMVHYVPGGLFELILPFWLFAKGFNAGAISERVTA